MAVREKSLRKAAAAAETDAGDAAERISRLESEAGCRLLSRTHAGVFPTQEGEAFYAAWREAAEEFEHLSGSAAAERQKRIVLSVPTTSGTTLLAPIAVRYAQVHGLRTDIRFTHGSFHPLWDGVDIRIGHGRYQLEDVQTHPLGSIRRIAVASPLYLETHEPILTPEDLMRPDVFGARNSVEEGGITVRRGKEIRRIRLSPDSAVRNHLASLTCVLSGLGVGVLIPAYLAAPHMKRGELVQVLSEWTFPGLPLRAFTANPVPEYLKGLLSAFRTEFETNPCLEPLND